MNIFVDFKLGNNRCMFGSSLSNEQEREMISTAISITKYENEAALEERREEAE